MAFPEDLEFCKMLFELEPLLPKAKYSIQLIVEQLERGYFTSWRNIKPLIIQLCNQVFFVDRSISTKRINKFIYGVLTLFHKHKYPDVSVIADFLEILCLTIFYYNTRQVGEKVMAIRFPKRNVETNITIFEMILVLPYQDFPSFLSLQLKSEKYLSDQNWVEILTYYRQVRLLKAIVLFGATLIVPEDSKFQRSRVIDTMCQLLSIDGQIIRDYWLRNMESQFDKSSRKRLFFLNLVLRVLVKSNFDTAADEYIKCIRILTRSTPEPLITSEEIKSSIIKLFDGIHITHNKKVQKLLEMYGTHFPESLEASKPRSLKHLSRFQVRERLRIARSFPHGVESLPVPKKIQDYICLKDILL